jgi:hypothetical protein
MVSIHAEPRLVGMWHRTNQPLDDNRALSLKDQLEGAILTLTDQDEMEMVLELENEGGVFTIELDDDEGVF